MRTHPWHAPPQSSKRATWLSAYSPHVLPSPPGAAPPSLASRHLLLHHHNARSESRSRAASAAIVVTRAIEPPAVVPAGRAERPSSLQRRLRAVQPLQVAAARRAPDILLARGLLGLRALAACHRLAIQRTGKVVIAPRVQVRNQSNALATVAAVISTAACITAPPCARAAALIAMRTTKLPMIARQLNTSRRLAILCEGGRGCFWLGYLYQYGSAGLSRSSTEAERLFNRIA